MKPASYQLTEHGRKRAAQRAIPGIVIDLLLEYGDMKEQKGGSCLLKFDRRQRKTFIRDLKKLMRSISNDASPYAVVDDSGLVVTVGHRH